MYSLLTTVEFVSIYHIYTWKPYKTHCAPTPSPLSVIKLLLIFWLFNINKTHTLQALEEYMDTCTVWV